MKKIKYFRVYVYRWEYGDCTNDGVSSQYSDLLVEHELGNHEMLIDPENAPGNLMILAEKGDYKYLLPYNSSGKGWYCMGGNYAAASGSPWWEISKAAIPIHDRKEW